ncbi:uncharacterized protein LOC129314458 [Prosopis cineraria]|uniref:uncharacterized protein LOC129314458 n=1 Tax=Prosopis cineraria TaxID=364024 RepID=UPI00240F6E02|nr:uncharacterized protein LOC129314458 [Prosopis cineraria]
MQETMNLSKKEKLRRDARRGKWSEVFETYEKERALRTTKITATGDTVLHMLVSNGEEKMVANLVDFLVREEKGLKAQNKDVMVPVDGDDEETQNKDEVVPVDGDDGETENKDVVVPVNVVLGAQNTRKNTPLHLAASMGKVEICKKIGRAVPSLIAKRNIAGETPLFLAALCGKKNAFLWLHYIYRSRYPEVSPTDHCIRNDKDTILHCAIAEGHFDVAIEIVDLYEDLVKATSINNEGLSPLHLLAAMPSAFKSSSLFDRPYIDYLIYHLLPIREKKGATKIPDLDEEHKPNVSDYVLKLINDICSPGHGYEYRFSPTWSEKVFDCIILVLHHLLEILERGGWRKLNGIRKKKEMHKSSVQIMNALLKDASESANGTPLERSPTFTESVSSVKNGEKKIETPLIIAAKNGVKEMVEKILELFPSSIEDVNDEGKNIVLLAAEKRQTKVYQFLCEKKILNENLFRQADKEGNSALHLAARLGDEPWLIPGEALQMQWEIKWFNFVKDSVPPRVFARYNNSYETPYDIFRETHKNLVTSGGKWLSKTSQACSVVSTLIATVAFSTIGDLPPKFTTPTPENKTGFKWFASSSLVAFCSSLISTFLFLSILTSRYQPIDFHMELPRRLIFGMTFLFLAIANIWLSFCVGHAFLLEQHFRNSYQNIYILASVLVTVFVLEQFPLYFDLITANFTKVPSPSHKATPAIEYRSTKKKENINGGSTDGIETTIKLN